MRPVRLMLAFLFIAAWFGLPARFSALFHRAGQACCVFVTDRVGSLVSSLPPQRRIDEA
jgi:hypothetical protein